MVNGTINRQGKNARCKIRYPQEEYPKKQARNKGNAYSPACSLINKLSNRPCSSVWPRREIRITPKIRKHLSNPKATKRLDCIVYPMKRPLHLDRVHLRDLPQDHEYQRYHDADDGAIEPWSVGGSYGNLLAGRGGNGLYWL
jgi:hypothetical protein